MESQRRIKITWGTSVQSASFRQTIINHNTGTARVWSKQEPSSWKREGTVLGNPQDPEDYHSKTKSEGIPRRQDYQRKPATEEGKEDKKKSVAANRYQDEYDTSQL
ncbi:hypothetical protein Slin14017_G037130 [Septoria linicola]|nr:hypothetical protein Slin14017_G037130 [Septoria linicola]